MTHEQLTQFDIYRRACFGSQAMCFCLVNHIEQIYSLTPTVSTAGYLQWQPNFALVQTLGVRAVNLTINLSGKESNYRGIGVDDLFRSPWKGLTRLRFTNAGRIADLIAATERAHAIKTKA
jgi:hypothetical protein